MRTYRIIFTPTEPYFFGNEKTFRFDSKVLGQYDNPYFIRSERTPAQTTVFGAVRYLLLKNRKSDFSGYPDGYDNIIGSDSWKITETNQDFGKIKGISPIFLYRQDSGDKDGIYLHAPLDHYHNRARDKNKPDIYTPFALCDIEKDAANRQYSKDYDPKEGLVDGYMNINSGEIVDSGNIFGTTVRVGIDVKKSDSAFFKKEYGYLKKNWSFGIYLDIDDNYCEECRKEGKPIIEDASVYLGQNKAAFKVSFAEAKNDLASAENLIADNTIYCISDIYASSDVYNYSSFSITNTRDHRSLETEKAKDSNGRPQIHKGDKLYRLISAGSVLCFNDDVKRNAITSALMNEHCQTVGMNHTIVGIKKSN